MSMTITSSIKTAYNMKDKLAVSFKVCACVCALCLCTCVCGCGCVQSTSFHFKRLTIGSFIHANGVCVRWERAKSSAKILPVWSCILILCCHLNKWSLTFFSRFFSVKFIYWLKRKMSNCPVTVSTPVDLYGKYEI